MKTISSTILHKLVYGKGIKKRGALRIVESIYTILLAIECMHDLVISSWSSGFICNFFVSLIGIMIYLMMPSMDENKDARHTSGMIKTKV